LGDFALDVTFGGVLLGIWFPTTARKLITPSEIQTFVKDFSLATDKPSV
jgi:hypothetical protein